MADLAIAAAEVLPDTDGIIEHGTGGEVIDAGEFCYKKSSDSKWYLADADAAATAGGAYMAVSSCLLANQKVSIQKTGSPTVGATGAPTVGTFYFASTTPGKACPAADLLSGDYKTLIGCGQSSNKMKLQVWASGIAVP